MHTVRTFGLIVVALIIATIGCDSSDSDGKDHVLRIINSLSVDDLQFTYDYPSGGRTVTLSVTGGPGPETLESVSFVTDEAFGFEARWNDRIGRASCTVGQAAVDNGAADVIVFPTTSLRTGRDTVEIQCASNWK